MWRLRGHPYTPICLYFPYLFRCPLYIWIPPYVQMPCCHVLRSFKAPLLIPSNSPLRCLTPLRPLTPSETPIPSETPTLSRPQPPSEPPNSLPDPSPFLDPWPQPPPWPQAPSLILSDPVPDPIWLAWVVHCSNLRGSRRGPYNLCVVFCSSDRQLILLLSLPQIGRWTTHTSHMGSFLSIYAFQHIQTYNAFCIIPL